MKRIIFALAAVPLFAGVAEARTSHATAKRAMNADFTVCGIPYKFPDGKIDWEYNPTYNGYREWPWQFARHSFLRDLAAYYRDTGDEKAAEAYVRIVEHFIDNALPPPSDAGPGATKSWRTIDTGLRATAWIDSYSAITNSAAFTPAFRTKFVNSLAAHVARLIPRRTANNWRTMELRGLIDVVLEFPELDPRGERRKAAEREMAGNLDSQLYPDGFQFELTPGYHSILDADYSKLALRYRAHGMAPPEFLEKGIERAFEMYTHLTRPDLKAPGVNDSGDLPIVAHMKVASGLYPRREDFRYFATERKEGRAPDYLSYAFPYAGAVTFRSSWRADAVWGYVDMSPFGYSHQHEDKLNFLIHAYGKKMLTEGGTYDYDSSEMRKYVLSTRSHNTIRIDGRDQCARRTWAWKPERIREKADLQFSTSPTQDVATATFAGPYANLGANRKTLDLIDTVSHTRTVVFVKNEGAPYFRVVDRLEARDGKEHTYAQQWHLETCEFKMGDDGFEADFGDGVKLTAAFRSANGRLTDHMGEKTPEWQGWMPIRPSGPHEHRPIHTPILEGTFRGSATIEAEFRPFRGK